jgi:tol-pal system beta propeller repeat protein TolB
MPVVVVTSDPKARVKLMATARSIFAITFAILWLAPPIDAQRARTKSRPAAKAAAKTRSVEQPTRSPLPTVLVLPAGDPTDSIRAIIQRDLDNGDRVDPIAVHSSLLEPLVPEGSSPPDLAALTPLGAQHVIVLRRSPGTLYAALYDAVTMRRTKTHRFEMPNVPEDRSQEIRDSVVALYDSSEPFARLAALGVARDSLTRAGKKRWPWSRTDPAQAAVRDSLLEALGVEETALRAQLERKIAERDRLIDRLLARHTAVRAPSVAAERMALHAAADEIHLWLTGKRGHAATRIAYVRDNRLHVIDSDGANDRPVTHSGTALSPSWHPSGQALVFSELRDGGTRIAEVELPTGRVDFLAAAPRGLNITPVYSPDGDHIVFATVRNGVTRLLRAERGGTEAEPIMTVAGEASNPSFSPDGRRLAFISPREWIEADGSPRMTPQIFIASINGKQGVQLTPSKYGVRSYRTSPDWSPDGQFVAYTQQGPGFHIWLIGVRDRKMRPLTKEGENEDPSWAPDSRHIAISSTRSGSREIWIVDAETGRMRQLTNGGNARLPDWSPYLRPPEPVVTASASRRPK